MGAKTTPGQKSYSLKSSFMKIKRVKRERAVSLRFRAPIWNVGHPLSSLYPVMLVYNKWVPQHLAFVAFMSFFLLAWNSILDLNNLSKLQNWHVPMNISILTNWCFPMKKVPSSFAHNSVFQLESRCRAFRAKHFCMTIHIYDCI